VIEIVGGVLVRGGELLLGRRSPHKRICPDTWDVLGGHRENGEPVLANDEHTELRWFAIEDAASPPNLAADAYRVLFRRLAGHRRSAP